MGAVAVIAAVILALAVVGVAWGLYQLVFPDRTAADRIAALTGGVEEGRPKPRAVELGTLAKQAAKLGVQDEEHASALRRRLMQAGYRERNSVEVYSALRAGLALVGALIGFLVIPKSSLALMLLGALGGATIGYYGPAIWVSNKLQNRQSDLLKAFPDALDLLVSCVEAGLGLDAAFRRVADEMGSSAPELSKEFQVVTNEVNAGVPRAEALHRLGERTGLEEITSLVNVLVQAERFGTSVARSLRVHSEMVRTKRMQRAEEKAAQVSPKLTVAMIIFILPCLLIILLGPALINVKNVLLPTMASGQAQ